MANIKISELLPARSDLLNENPNLINELNNEELRTTLGGGYFYPGFAFYKGFNSGFLL
jgi:hypothetical protein